MRARKEAQEFIGLVDPRDFVVATRGFALFDKKVTPVGRCH